MNVRSFGESAARVDAQTLKVNDSAPRPYDGISGFHVMLTGQIESGHGVDRGISQIARKGANTGNAVIWNFPIDATFKATNVYGWPRLVVSVYGEDMLGRDVIRGYGSVCVPPIPGTYTQTVRLFTPMSSSPLQQFIAWLTGNQPEFFDAAFVAQSDGREVTRVKSTGSVRVTITVTTKDMTSFGYATGGATDSVLPQPIVAGTAVAATGTAFPATPFSSAAGGRTPARLRTPGHVRANSGRFGRARSPSPDGTVAQLQSRLENLGRSRSARAQRRQEEPTQFSAPETRTAHDSDTRSRQTRAMDMPPPRPTGESRPLRGEPRQRSDRHRYDEREDEVQPLYAQPRSPRDRREHDRQEFLEERGRESSRSRSAYASQREVAYDRDRGRDQDQSHRERSDELTPSATNQRLQDILSRGGSARLASERAGASRLAPLSARSRDRKPSVGERSDDETSGYRRNDDRQSRAFRTIQ